MADPQLAQHLPAVAGLPGVVDPVIQAQIEQLAQMQLVPRDTVQAQLSLIQAHMSMIGPNPLDRNGAPALYPVLPPVHPVPLMPQDQFRLQPQAQGLQLTGQPPQPAAAQPHTQNQQETADQRNRPHVPNTQLPQQLQPQQLAANPLFALGPQASLPPSLTGQTALTQALAPGTHPVVLPQLPQAAQTLYQTFPLLPASLCPPAPLVEKGAKLEARTPAPAPAPAPPAALAPGSSIPTLVLPPASEPSLQRGRLPPIMTGEARETLDRRSLLPSPSASDSSEDQKLSPALHAVGQAHSPALASPPLQAVEKLSSAMAVRQTEEGRYRCEHCGRMYSLHRSLMQHLKIHLEKCPYQCKDCGRRFSRKGHVEAHIRTHTQEKPYACRICKKSFNQKSGLFRHVRAYHHSQNVNQSVPMAVSPLGVYSTQDRSSS